MVPSFDKGNQRITPLVWSDYAHFDGIEPSTFGLRVRCSTCIVAEVILHFRQEIDHSVKKRIIISDLLQLPVSFLFTRLMNLLSNPDQFPIEAGRDCVFSSIRIFLL